MQDNSARVAELRAALSVVEGRLLIVDEVNAVIFDQVVSVKTSDLPQEWRQHVSEVNVTFECRRVIADEAAFCDFHAGGRHADRASKRDALAGGHSDGACER